MPSPSHVFSIPGAVNKFIFYDWYRCESDSVCLLLFSCAHLFQQTFPVYFILISALTLHLSGFLHCLGIALRNVWLILRLLSVINVRISNMLMQSCVSTFGCFQI